MDVAIGSCKRGFDRNSDQRSAPTPPVGSTDDDKIVAWHWEEVKGPLRDEKVSADTPILTLTSLVPGNYTFR